MYGLVNYSIRKMITEEFGADVWEAVLAESGVGAVFEKAENYPDSETLKLATAISKVAKLELADVLTAYGKWWIGFAKSDYPQLFAAAGNTFAEFLGNMNNTHRRVAYLFPDSIAPRFDITDQQDNTFTLKYYSQREGFYPFVLGLVQGLGDAFDTTVEVEYKGQVNGDSCESFTVKYIPQA